MAHETIPVLPRARGHFPGGGTHPAARQVSHTGAADVRATATALCDFAGAPHP